MAIYLLCVILWGLIYNIIQLISYKTIAQRIGALIALGITLPPYIWYVWFSKLVF